MTESLPPPPADAAEQADYWLALHDSPLFDDSQRRLFRQWLEASRENREAWKKAQGWWQAIDGLNASQATAVEKRFAEPNFAQQTGAQPPSQRWRINGALPAAACLILLIGLGYSVASGYFADFHTSTGEQRWIQLSDGSSVLLNTDSALSVEYSDRQRHIKLHGGEAYFKVAPDAQRPFEVLTDSGRVRALGTAFDVKQRQDAITVTVYEHSVRVASRQGEIVEGLAEGQRVTASDSGVGPVETIDPKQARAWRERRLVFKDMPLRQVVAELDRYRAGKIVIVDRALAEHRVTGVFDAADPEAALSAIEKTLAVTETRLTDRLVFLRL